MYKNFSNEAELSNTFKMECEKVLEDSGYNTQSII